MSATSQPAPDPGGALTFGPAVIIGTAPDQVRYRGGEPSVQSGLSGTLWSTNAGPSQIWKSSDRGSTWAFVAPPLTLGGGDMDAAEDDAGRVHVVDLTDGFVNRLGCIFYYRSTDGGRTFDIVRATHGGGVWVDGDGGCGTTATTGGHVDRPWVATLGDRTVYIVYRDSTSGSRNLGGSVDMSVDGGNTFTHASIGDPLPAPDSMAVDPVDGTVYVVGTDAGTFDAPLNRSHGRSVRVTTFKDGQQKSSTLVIDSSQIDTRAGGFPTLAVDAGHNVYAAWNDNSAGTFDVYVSVSRDHAVTWSTPVRVSHGQTVATYATIVAGAAGRVAVAWYGTADPAKARYDAAGATWYVYVAQSINALDAAPTYSTVKASDAPFHHGSICRDAALCEGMPTTTLPANYEVGIADFFQMTLDNTGAIVVIWTDTTGASGPKDHVARQIGGPLLKASSLTPALTQKIQSINSFAARPTSDSQSTVFTESELNAYIHTLGRAQSSSIADLTVTLTGPNRMTLRGVTTGRVPVTIDGQVTAQNGIVTLTIDGAKMGEQPMDARSLKSVLDAIVDPRSAGFSLSSPFQLPARIRDLSIDRGRLTMIQ
ncbi:MAG TPA: sialidase family protein [Vicinamibacterales bacterium]|nr:sialidase family protein [Vicinamibacterales bacterium]